MVTWLTFLRLILTQTYMHKRAHERKLRNVPFHRTRVPLWDSSNRDSQHTGAEPELSLRRSGPPQAHCRGQSAEWWPPSLMSLRNIITSSGRESAVSFLRQDCCCCCCFCQFLWVHLSSERRRPAGGRKWGSMLKFLQHLTFLSFIFISFCCMKITLQMTWIRFNMPSSDFTGHL